MKTIKRQIEYLNNQTNQLSVQVELQTSINQQLRKVSLEVKETDINLIDTLLTYGTPTFVPMNDLTPTSDDAMLWIENKVVFDKFDIFLVPFVKFEILFRNLNDDSDNYIIYNSLIGTIIETEDIQGETDSRFKKIIFHSQAYFYQVKDYANLDEGTLLMNKRYEAKIFIYVPNTTMFI